MYLSTIIIYNDNIIYSVKSLYHKHHGLIILRDNRSICLDEGHRKSHPLRRNKYKPTENYMTYNM